MYSCSCNGRHWCVCTHVAKLPEITGKIRVLYSEVGEITGKSPVLLCGYVMLQSAVGKTHVLRSGLVMDYTTSYFPFIVLGYPLDSKLSYGPLSDTLCPGA